MKVKCIVCKDLFDNGGIPMNFNQRKIYSFNNGICKRCFKEHLDDFHSYIKPKKEKEK